jgi:hypothetical protein
MTEKMPIRTDSAAGYLDPPELDDAFTPPAPPPDRVVDERPDDGWNKRASKFAIAFGRTIVRGGPGGPVVLGHRDECCDCLLRGRSERGHQFHIQCSRLTKGGPMVGPESAHWLDLLEGGLVAGSPQATEWQSNMGLRMATLGVAPEAFCRNCRRDLRQPDSSFAPVCSECHIRNGMSEILPMTTSQVAKVWAHDLRGGQEAITARENELLRNDIKVFADAAAGAFEKGGNSLATAIEEGVARGFAQAMSKLGDGEKPKEK